MTGSPARSSAGPTVHVVPHTHWDREWYLPFQRFRLRLVDLIDGVLDTMEADERFVFTLDGQLATVDDYLEVRPDAAARIRALVEAGRLAIGPWQVLMDEFLVSGESIVRNLEAGTRRAEELGGAMPVGYLPDMFGHVAQMPQILRRAGIEHAVVWRGVPAAIDRNAFEWAAPDGSAVRAEYLPAGYGNGAYLFDVPGGLAEKVARLAEAMRPFFDGDDVLAMAGTDHMEPRPGLTDDVDRARADGDVPVTLSTLADYIGTRAPAALRWEGELRSAARANLLPNVTSARIDLKAAAARAERALERYAEPLAALHGDDWPAGPLAIAWSRVLQNSAHDSICGCSADAVSRQVLVRYDEAEQIGVGLTRRAADAAARAVPRGSFVVLNPSPAPRSDLVEVDVSIPDDWRDVALELTDGTRLVTQEVARSTPLRYVHEVRGADLPSFLARRLHGRELFRRTLNAVEIAGRVVTLRVAEEPEPGWLDVDLLRTELELAAHAAPDDVWEIRIEDEPRRRLAALVPAPPLGAVGVRAVRGRATDRASVVTATPARLDNGLLTVEVAADGTLTLGGLERVGRLVDGGDAGDSYNYAPPEDDVVVDTPQAVEVELTAAGPLRGELVVTRTYAWRDGATPIEMRLELRAGEPFLRIRVSLDNRATDHRLRFHVPLAQPVERSAAEGQFAVVERGLEPEAGYGEEPIGTYPAHGFVDAGGMAVLLDHALEYEVVDGRELALTLLRSIGLISRNDHRFREDPAGPELPIPDAQCRGPWSVAFALLPHTGTWAADRVLDELERYRLPFVTRPGTGRAPARLRDGIEVVGEGVVLSALRRRGAWLELRLVCEQPEGRRAEVRGGFAEAQAVDLLGRDPEPLALDEGTLRLDLDPWEIRTVQVRRD